MAGDNDPVADEPEAADEADLVEVENWPELAALTSFFLWSCRESNEAQKSC
jgi:hypothetical protein